MKHWAYNTEEETFYQASERIIELLKHQINEVNQIRGIDWKLLSKIMAPTSSLYNAILDCDMHTVNDMLTSIKNKDFNI